ncbi:TetR/AcrR family transcriptional regulator [Notoacmeibacter ruber]|uniref:TetR/AcrR family transcriptional regulator n=2 Tax=Notoacmeibacter ruber TaxID=2670375 RepID=A0A3L7J410_9HYPH|nr:TetR/AcrR family transcriptional regulator [Notoacmeibacter ruber]
MTATKKNTIAGAQGSSERPLRADARRNVDTVVQSARKVFAESGVDAPMREIATEAGVGVGTIYRHFPQRADLIAAVFRHEVDACAAAAAQLLGQYAPGEALDRWMQRYVDFIVAKRGLASSLYSGAAAYEGLPTYFDKHLEPALQALIDAAAASKEIRADVSPNELLRAVANLCRPAGDDDPAQARLLVALLVDGLRYRGTK